MVRYQSGCDIVEGYPVAAIVRSRTAGAIDIEGGAIPRALGGRKTQ